MKFPHFLVFILFKCCVFSQNKTGTIIADYNSCKVVACKVEKAIKISEYFLDNDNITESQKWLDYAKKSSSKSPNKNNQYLINSLQSELFYYMGLYQFGLHESQKGIELSKELNDSLYISNAYLIEGVNYFEMEDFKKSENALQIAKKYFPVNSKSKLKRFEINREYIYNNIAQIKIKTKQLDSSYFYNSKAYSFSKNLNNYRCIANVERTFGELFMIKNKIDSAHIYFEKSIETSIKAKIYDTALLGYGNLIQLYKKNDSKIIEYYIKGENIIEQHIVNSAFKKLFYKQSLKVFESIGIKSRMLTVQKKLLELDEEINANENFYIQNIVNQYINSENKLLLSKINELDKQKNIKILQLLAALFLALIFLLVIIIIKRKNKLQKSLLDQKSEISKDLHDDIGSELSSILINTNLLKNYETNDKQKVLLEKINNTGLEISQRLHTFIWSLNTDNNTVQNFSEYVKQYSYKFLDGTLIRLNFDDDTEIISNKVFDGNSRKNLFFCIKEVLNNCIKHSDATQVSILITSFEKKELQIIIHDNGKGLLSSNKFGNGLINIKKRISNLNGTLEINSSNGLKINIKVQL